MLSKGRTIRAAVKRFRPELVMLAAALLLAGAAGPDRSTTPFEFALIGDMPYTDEATTNAFPNLIDEINRAPMAFVIHDGDIKSGSTPCTDEVFHERYRQFQSFRHPLVYIFGDNEWQDCRGNRTNKFDPLERLNKLREIFAKGDRTLGRRTFRLTRQSEQGQFEEFRENVRWTYGDVLFAGFNLPGDANNYGQPEYKKRHEANLSWLKESFTAAREQNRRGIMLIIQANPHFDLASTNLLRLGFNEFLAALENETIEFRKPVVLVHGDTHYFRIDKPLVGTKSKRRLENFTRVETFGYPDVHWLKVRVDWRDPNLFSFDPRIVRKNLIDHTH